MLFFFIRHGDPIYSPDGLTPLGTRQAEALAKRLALYGIDKIYSSSSERAKLTAQPTCELLNKEMEILDWCNEGHAWNQLTYVDYDGERRWIFHPGALDFIMASEELAAMRFEWYEHPALKEYNYKEGIDRIKNETYKLMAGLGFEFDPERGIYKHTKDVYDRVALFAHQGFGLAFLSCLLHIPYPKFCSNFDMGHSGMTVINFEPINGYAFPKVLTMSDDSHIYREGLPTKYQNTVFF